MDSAEIVQEEELPLFQEVDGGSIPTSPLFFSMLGHKSVMDVIIKNHYTHRKAPCTVGFAAWIGGPGKKLVGAMSFGKPASGHLCRGICGPENESKIYELNRLWMTDSCPKNSESKFIGWALRFLKKKMKKDWIIVSYADTAQKHTGTIYRASNFIYTGLTKTHKDYQVGNRHSRHVKDSTQGRSVVYRSPKHRYVYFLDSSVEKFLRYKNLNDRPDLTRTLKEMNNENKNVNYAQTYFRSSIQG